MTDSPADDWFHQAALAVGFVAHAEGWLADSERVRRAVYALYETGEWPAGPGFDRAAADVLESTEEGTP